MNYKRLLDNTTLNSYSRISAKCDGGNCNDSSIYAVDVDGDIVAWYSEEIVNNNVDILVNVSLSGCWNNVYDMFGNEMEKICGNGNQLSLKNVTDSPMYLTNYSNN